LGKATAAQVRRILAAVGDPIAVAENERARIAAPRDPAAPGRATGAVRQVWPPPGVLAIGYRPASPPASLPPVTPAALQPRAPRQPDLAPPATTSRAAGRPRALRTACRPSAPRSACRLRAFPPGCRRHASRPLQRTLFRSARHCRQACSRAAPQLRTTRTLGAASLRRPQDDPSRTRTATRRRRGWTEPTVAGSTTRTSLVSSRTSS